MRLAQFGLACLALATTVSGQRPQAPNSPQATAGVTVVVGRVVEGLSSTPVAEAVVWLTGRSGSTVRLATLTTGGGEFVFASVPAGSYNLTADRAGYWFGSFGTRRSGGQGRALELKAGVPRFDVAVPVWPMSAMEGTVRDEAGEPVVGVRVEASTTIAIGGRPYPSSPMATLTDDRGRYRIAGLGAGHFIVAVRSLPITAPDERASDGRVVPDIFSRGIDDSRPGSPDRLEFRGVGVLPGSALTPPVGDGRWYPTVFFPSTETAHDAELVSLSQGQTRHGVDFNLRPVVTRKVSGKLVPADGVTAANVPLRLYRLDSSGEADTIEAAIAFTSANGDFVFPAVTPGVYEARAFDLRHSRDGFGMFSGAGVATTSTTRAISISNDIATEPPTRWAQQSITVGGDDVDGLSIPLHMGLTIEGWLVFEGTAQSPNLQQRATSTLTVTQHTGAPAAQPASSTALIDPSGAFRTIGLSSGRYFVRSLGTSFPAPWAVKSVSLRGREILDEPIALDSESVTGLTITLTDRSPEVTVTARSASSQPDETATVLVFPSDERAWIDFGRSSFRYRQARVNDQGVATLKGLPPGDYLVAAVPDENSDQWQLQSRLRALARTATRVTLGLGDSKTIEVRTNRENR